MKELNQYLSSKLIKEDWEYMPSSYSGDGEPLSELNDKNVKWIFINTETEVIMPVTEKDLDNWAEDFGIGDEFTKAVKALKIGESYDADGGISIYVRIKK